MADKKFRFINEKCPVCNNCFKEDEDIAVCPDCGTPHHRECYKTNIRCANHEKHSESFRWEPDFVSLETKELPKSEVNEQPVSSAEQTPFFPIQINSIPSLLNGMYEDFEDDVKAEDVALFVRQDSQKYVSKFHNIKKGKATWNWAAFFFAPYWFFYRKMYKLGAIFLALTLLISIGFSMSSSIQKLYTDMTEWTTKYNIENINELSEEDLLRANDERIAFMSENTTGVILVFVQAALTIALDVLIGLMANKWYYKHSLKHVKEIKAQEKDQQKQKILFLQHGGTSVGGFFLAVLANNMVVMAAEMLLTFIK